MNHKISFYLYQAGTALLLILMLASVLLKNKYLGYVGVGVFFLGYFQTFKFCRCPGCGKLINLRSFRLTRCLHCGLDLRQ